MQNLAAPGIAAFWIFLYGAIVSVTSIVFVVIAWRAMRAHERIAGALEQNLQR